MKRNLLLFILICFSTTTLNASRVYNFFVANNEMPGFGDLISNWYSAVATKNKDSSALVNFILTEPFAEKFKIVEKDFNSEMKIQTIKSIRVIYYPLLKDEFEDFLSKELIRDEKYTCSLAFTINRNNLLNTKSPSAKMLGYLAQNNIKSPFLYFELPVLSQLALLRLNDNNYKLPKLYGGPNYNENNYFYQVAFHKSGNKKPSPPLFAFLTTALNGNLFIGEKDPMPHIPVSSLKSEYDFLGYFYAYDERLKLKYLQGINKLAKNNPQKTFAVIAAKSVPKNSKAKVLT